MKKFKKGLTYFILIFMSLLFLAPFLWMFVTAVKPKEEIFLFPPKWIPSTFVWSNFIKAWTVQPFNTFLWNTIIIVVLCTLGQVISCSLVAYGFARFKFKGREILFMILLATMMIPWDVTMIPQYMEFNKFGWINTLKPLIVPAWFGGAFNIFLLRQFILTIPGELEEAAIIDGANKFQVYSRIFMPLMKPPLILVSIFTVLGAWNDYLGPLIFINDQSKYTLALGLAQFKGMNGVDTASIMAITIIMVIPPLIIFFLGQKYIVEGIASTGIKS